MKDNDWFFDKFDRDFDKTVKRTFNTALVLTIGYMLFWATVIIVAIVFAVHLWW